MVEIKVFGTTPPCAKCKQAEEAAKRAAQEFGDQVSVKKLDAMSAEGDKYQVMVTPTVVVGDRVVAVGKVVPASELVDAIKKELGG